VAASRRRALARFRARRYGPFPSAWEHRLALCGQPALIPSLPSRERRKVTDPCPRVMPVPLWRKTSERSARGLSKDATALDVVGVTRFSTPMTAFKFSKESEAGATVRYWSRAPMRVQALRQRPSIAEFCPMVELSSRRQSLAALPPISRLGRHLRHLRTCKQTSAPKANRRRSQCTSLLSGMSFLPACIQAKPDDLTLWLKSRNEPGSGSCPRCPSPRRPSQGAGPASGDRGTAFWRCRLCSPRDSGAFLMSLRPLTTVGCQQRVSNGAAAVGPAGCCETGTNL